MWPPLPFLLLVGYGVAFAAASLGVGVIAYDDHPGQLYRAWHVVRHGFAPWRWDDGWWAGYPELQFYPPLFSYAVAVVHKTSLATLSVPMSYQLMAWLTYLAPGLTTFLLLARIFRSGWLALPGAFVALTLSAGLTSGVEGGVHTGMVAARLGWSLLPLLALTLRHPIESPARWSPWTPLLIAAIVVTHPAHLPAALALVLVAVSIAAGGRRRATLSATVVLALAALLTAFWTAPLLARLAETRALAWRGESPALTFSHPLSIILVGLALIELARVLTDREPSVRRPLERLVALSPWGVAAALVVVFVAERVGVRWLPIGRVIDGYWMAIILAGGMGLGRLVRLAAERTGRSAALVALALVALGIVTSLPSGTLTLWARAAEWPSLASVERGLRLPQLWATLHQGPAGRVLYVRSSVPLVHGTEWYRPHTHVTALTPLAAGRPIIHGTFTHPSPVATLLYRGDVSREAVSELAEVLDGRTLFGRPLETLTAPDLVPYVDRLAFDTIVAIEDDAPRLQWLDGDSMFRRVTATPPFLVYVRRAPLPIPTAVSNERWTFRATGSAGAWVSARTTFYPLWAARDGRVDLETRRGALGDLEIRLARSGDAEIELTYRPGLPELSGIATTALATVIWLVWAVRAALGPREL